MKNILYIISSPRKGNPHSIKLGNVIVEKIKEVYPDSVSKYIDLVESEFPHLRQNHLNAFFTPIESRIDDDHQSIRCSDESIADLMETDIIVLSAPMSMCNYTVHFSLKEWIDHISRNGYTFKNDKNGGEGLLKNKKVYVAVTSGFVYTDVPMRKMDFTTPYLTSMFGFLGMTDVTFFRIEGTVDPLAIQKGIDSIAIA